MTDPMKNTSIRGFAKLIADLLEAENPQAGTEEAILQQVVADEGFTVDGKKRLVAEFRMLENQDAK